MTLTEQIAEDLKSAMKNREKEKLEALRAVKTAFTLARVEISQDAVLSSEQELKIIQKLVKQRIDSAAEFNAQNRKDLADKELFEASVISVYLPAQMSKDELEKKIKEFIAQSGATSIKEMGKVMAIASKELAGKADNKAISDIIKSILS